jgi:C1A family cysteine protease
MREKLFSRKTLWLLLVLATSLFLLLSLLPNALIVKGGEPPFAEAPKRLEPQGKPPVIDGHGTGYIPPPMDLSHLTGQTLPKTLPKGYVGQPSSFDWRTSGNVTPVKDQGSCGSCWAFASIGNIESKMLIDIPYTYDFSENSVKECNYQRLHGLGATCSTGGNYFITANWLSQKGTVLESDDPYVASDVSCNSSCTYQKTLLDWRIICGDSVPDTTALKNYIYNYGPVYTTMYASFSGFSSYNGSYTLYYAGTDAPNHAVLIVGWDDSLAYDKGGGQTGYGAWIVKNSWGTDWGGACGYGTERGYFTIAYGSASIGKNSSFIYRWQDYDSNGGIMYYDECGWTASGRPAVSTTAWGLCKFTLSNTYVNQVEFWTTDNTTDIDVYIYDSFDGSTLSGLLASKLNNSFAEAGYHSVALDSPYAVTASNDIYVVVEFTNSSYTYPIAVDIDGPNVTGSTYWSATGGSGTWTDLGTTYGVDVAIRVRTSGYPSSLSTLASYSDLTHNTACDNFTNYSSQHTAYMYATNLVPSHDYRVAYYDGSNNKVDTESTTSGASGNVSSQHTFNPVYDTAGIWHAIIFEATYTAPSTYSSSWPCILASDNFTVQSSAIPEFPIAWTVIVALGFSAGLYLWLRRRMSPVPA